MTIRDAFARISPPWLGEIAQRFMWTIGLVLDARRDFVEQGIKLRMPGVGSPEALPLIGNDRLIDRGPTEPNDNYAMRLSGAFDTWRTAGGPRPLLENMAAYFEPRKVRVMVVNDSGVWHDRDPITGEVTRTRPIDNGPPDTDPPPVLASLDFDLVDSDGGDTIKITGTRLDQLTSVGFYLGGAEIDNLLITYRSDSIVVGTVPAGMGSGNFEIVGTYGPSFAQTNRLPIELWSPANASSATVTHRWRPDRGVTMGAMGISVLNDIVGAMHQRQSTGFNQPILVLVDAAYGNKPTIQGDGTKVFLSDTDVASDVPVSMMVIGEINSPTSGFGGAMNSTTPYDLIWRQGDAVQFYNVATLTGPADGLIASPSTVLLTDAGSVGGASAAKLYVNDLVTPKASGATAWGATTVYNMLFGVAGVFHLKGKIAEVVIWSGVLSAADADRIRRYRAVRYGL